MKLRCIKINEKRWSLFKEYFQVGQVYDAKRVPNRYLNVVDVKDSVVGVTWKAVQKASKFNISLASGVAVTFELVTEPRRMVVTEKKIDRISDKRRHRRLCRQYGKLRFTEPGMFCFIAWRAMKDIARNYQR